MEHSKGEHVPTDGRDHTDALVIYASKGKTVLWTLVVVAFTVTSVVGPAVLSPLVRDNPHSFYENPTMDVLVQIAGGVLGSLMTIRMLTILFSTAPRVVVSHEGIWIDSLLFGSGIIPWAEIGALLVLGHRLPPVGILHIVLRDRQTLRNRQNRLQTLLWWLGGYALVWPQSVTVPDPVLPMSNVELVGRIRARFQHELVQHDIRVLGA